MARIKKAEEINYFFLPWPSCHFFKNSFNVRDKLGILIPESAMIKASPGTPQNKQLEPGQDRKIAALRDLPYAEGLSPVFFCLNFSS